MAHFWPTLLAQFPRPNGDGTPWTTVALVGVLFLVILIFMFAMAVLAYGRLWFQAYMSNARVGFLSLIGMSLRQVNSRVILQGKIMALQAGVGSDPHTGITTRRLEAHYLAGGNVPGVINAIIAAHRADIDLDFDRAAAIDLAGRDVLEAVRTSVNPKVIDCPDPVKSKKSHLSAVAKNGVELRIRARVTVRTNLAQLIGGATEETIIAPRGGRDHHVDRFVGQPSGSDGESPPHLEGGARSRARRAHGVRDRVDRHRRHRRGREYRRPVASRPGRGRHACRAVRVPKSGAPTRLRANRK